MSSLSVQDAFLKIVVLFGSRAFDLTSVLYAYCFFKKQITQCCHFLKTRVILRWMLLFLLFFIKQLKLQLHDSSPSFQFERARKGFLVVTAEISQYQIRKLVSLNDPDGVWVKISREQRWETWTLIERHWRLIQILSTSNSQQFSD